MTEWAGCGPATVPGMDRPNAASLWRLYGRHAVALFASGPRPSAHVTDRWFFAATGTDHLDMNQAVLFGDATLEDAEAIARIVLEAEVPCLLGCSDGVLERVAPALHSAGFEQMPKREAMYWRPGPPETPGPSPFEIRRVRSDLEVAGMLAIVEEAHGYDPAMVDQLYGDRARGDDGFSAWIAWDGAEPVSFMIAIAIAGSLSLWEVQTPVRHRRRGAARAVVAGGLAGAAAAARQPIEDTLFWASPAGRPLYEAMGFIEADLVDAWSLGARPEDLAAVGA